MIFKNSLFHYYLAWVLSFGSAVRVISFLVAVAFLSFFLKGAPLKGKYRAMNYNLDGVYLRQMVANERE